MFGLIGKRAKIRRAALDIIKNDLEICALDKQDKADFEYILASVIEHKLNEYDVAVTFAIARMNSKLSRLDGNLTDFERKDLSMDWIRCRSITRFTVSEFVYWPALDEIQAKNRALDAKDP